MTEVFVRQATRAYPQSESSPELTREYAENSVLKIPGALLPVDDSHRRPRKQAKSRWRAPLESLVSWNAFERTELTTDGDIRFYIDELRAPAMYRGSESMEAWRDYAEIVEKLPSLKRCALRQSARKGSAPA